MNQAIETTPPEQIRLPKDRSALFVRWNDEGEIEISAAALRDQCRSAVAVAHSVRGLAVPASNTITITHMEAVGSYALNIAFSDGEERGIYPWSLLREIALGNPKNPQCNNLTDGIAASA